MAQRSRTGDARVMGRGVIARVVGFLRDPGSVLPVLFIAAFIVRAVWLELPRNALIFDETYYVNAARILLGLPVPAGAPYAGAPIGLDPNIEHPPLGKLLIALSMQVFGDNGLGWRLPSLVAGMVAPAALYLIVRSLRAPAWLAIMAVGFFAFDNLTIVHSRIGTLDMLALAAVLVAAWLALRGQWALAGVMVYALLALLILLAMEILDRPPPERRVTRSDVRRSVALVGSFAVVSLVGLWALDARFTTFATPSDPIGHMLAYGSSLLGPADRVGICAGINSAPWQWPFNECQIGYLRVDATIRVGGQVVRTIPSVDFRGALNPVLAGAIPLAALFAVWSMWRTRDPLARWAVVWAAANYVPFVVIALLSDRVMYIYYFLPVIPAVAIAVAILLQRARLPRLVSWGFVAAFALGVVAYFPFRQIP